MHHLKVIFLPWWSRNPYQQLLVTHLQALGVDVKTFSNNGKFFLTPEVIRWRPDIIHFHSLYPFYLSSNPLAFAIKLLAFFSQIIFLKLAGVRIVWTVHDLKNHENMQVRAERIYSIFLAIFADAIITHCVQAKQTVIKSFHIFNKGKVFVVSHPHYINYYENNIDRDTARKKLGITDANLIFLFLGLIRAYKGVPELIDAFKQLKQDKVYLVIAGKASQELTQQIQQQVQDCHEIKFIPGFVADEQLQIYMNACDAIVLPYRDILTSGSVILAMSFGRACVAPRKGCISEVVGDLGGFLYNPEETDSLLYAMKDAIQHNSQLQQIGDRNRRVVEQWSWDSFARTTLQIYQHRVRSTSSLRSPLN